MSMPVFRGALLEAEIAARGLTWGELAVELDLTVDTIRSARKGEAVSARTMRTILTWLHEHPPLYAEAAGLVAAGGSG
jgi:hypothetical protein